MFRELDGVAHQIDNNLPQTPRVADESMGNARIDATSQFQLLVARSQRQQVQSFPDAFR